ncbi:MAG: hypothetical protein A3G87_06930 [Omnitrophica bacterium RIFCSPLOWO2_12_FULL_50_11]|nr:MAG: hypothetical protein A3G87_06930 [Omnitrophica bacterium RIFCSPLOWO2_12_FULL_50_11]
MKKIVAFSIFSCFIFSVSAQAKDVWELAKSKQYKEKSIGMLGRGLLNAASSPIDMPVQAVIGAGKAKPEFVGFVGGFAMGAVCTVLRASSGVLDVATFWVPGFNGVPVSRSYENCLDFSRAEEKAAPPPSRYVPPPPPKFVTQAAVVPQQQEAAPTEEEKRLKYVKK